MARRAGRGRRPSGSRRPPPRCGPSALRGTAPSARRRAAGRRVRRASAAAAAAWPGRAPSPAGATPARAAARSGRAARSAHSGARTQLRHASRGPPY